MSKELPVVSTGNREPAQDAGDWRPYISFRTILVSAAVLAGTATAFWIIWSR